MNTHCLVPLIATIVYIPLFIIIFANGKWESQHKLFAWFLAAAMLWSLTDFFFRSDFFMQDKLLLFKLVMCSFSWGAIQLHYFIRSFHQTQKIKFPAAYVLLLAIIITIALGYVTKDVKITDSVTPEYGIGFIPLALSLYFILGRDIYYLTRKLMISTDPVLRNQLGYLLLGISTLVVFASTSFTPLGKEFPLAHLGNVFNAIIFIYAILVYRLLDMRFVFRRVLVWLALGITGIGVYVALFFLVDLAIGIEAKTANLIVAALGAVGATAAIYLLRDSFTIWIDRLFHKERYDYRQQLSHFISNKLSGVYDLRELGEKLIPLLAGSLNCQQAYLLLPENNSDDFIAEFIQSQGENEPTFKMRQNNPIIDWLKRKNSYLSRENLNTFPEFHGLWKEEKDKIESLSIELFFPLISRGNLIGILALGRKRSGRYVVEDISLAENVARQVATSMEKEYLQEQLRKREQELSVINRLASVISSSLNIQEVYDAFVEELRNVVDADLVTVVLIDGKEVHFEALSTNVGLIWKEGDKLPLEGTATAWIAEHKETLVDADLSKHIRFSTGETYLKHGIRSVVYLPLLVKGEAIGSLIIGSRQPDAYSQEKIRLLERLSPQIAVSIENGLLYSNAEKRGRIDELTNLYNRRHFDERLKQEIGRHGRYRGIFSLILLDLDHFKDYNDGYGHTSGDKLLKKISRILKKAIRDTDMAFRYGGDEFAIILPQSATNDSLKVAERIREKIVAEMKSQQIKITASLGLATWPSDGITPNELLNASDKALYYAKRTGSNRTCIVSQMLPSTLIPIEFEANTEKETLNTIYALAATIEARDTYTYGHSRKVSNYAATLAESLNLPSEKVATISTAALLHDIGKVGIPDEILNKQGNLTPEEWELIKSHPKLSATIVGHVSTLTPCLPAILHHHERWDGTGYPSGLKKENIPLEARILAIADAFDAMTSSRSYRDPLSYQEALRRLKLGAGTQFDAELIDAFIPIALATAPEEMEIGAIPGNSEAASL